MKLENLQRCQELAEEIEATTKVFKILSDTTEIKIYSVVNGCRSAFPILEIRVDLTPDAMPIHSEIENHSKEFILKLNGWFQLRRMELIKQLELL